MIDIEHVVSNFPVRCWRFKKIDGWERPPKNSAEINNYLQLCKSTPEIRTTQKGKTVASFQINPDNDEEIVSMYFCLRNVSQWWQHDLCYLLKHTVGKVWQLDFDTPTKPVDGEEAQKILGNELPLFRWTGDGWYLSSDICSNGILWKSASPDADYLKMLFGIGEAHNQTLPLHLSAWSGDIRYKRVPNGDYTGMHEKFECQIMKALDLNEKDFRKLPNMRLSDGGYSLLQYTRTEIDKKFFDRLRTMCDPLIRPHRYLEFRFEAPIGECENVVVEMRCKYSFNGN